MFITTQCAMLNGSKESPSLKNSDKEAGNADQQGGDIKQCEIIFWDT